jgi:hypothetical protein
VVACVIGRALHARQVKGDDSDKKGYPGLQGWGLGAGLTTPLNNKSVTKSKGEAKVRLGL